MYSRDMVTNWGCTLPGMCSSSTGVPIPRLCNKCAGGSRCSSLSICSFASVALLHKFLSEKKKSLLSKLQIKFVFCSSIPMEYFWLSKCLKSLKLGLNFIIIIKFFFNHINLVFHWEALEKTSRALVSNIPALLKSQPGVLKLLPLSICQNLNKEICLHQKFQVARGSGTLLFVIYHFFSKQGQIWMAYTVKICPNFPQASPSSHVTKF